MGFLIPSMPEISDISATIRRLGSYALTLSASPQMYLLRGQVLHTPGHLEGKGDEVFLRERLQFSVVDNGVDVLNGGGRGIARLLRSVALQKVTQVAMRGKLHNHI